MSDKGRVIALGFFDGVHIGHKALLDKAKERAAQMDLIPSVMNFDVHPDSLVFNRKIDLIYGCEKRTEIIKNDFEIDDIIMINFDKELMQTPWDVFLSGLAAEKKMKWTVIGYDFRLGYKGLGTPEKISDFCAENGIGLDIIPAVELKGNVVSSTLIRNCVNAGDIETANEMLGRPFSISGRIESGKQLGHKIGYPTINTKIENGITVPSFGVYATKTLIKGKLLESITNIGKRPTFYSDSEITLETNIFKCSEDLYGENSEIFFYKKIRDELKFFDASELSSQISEDIKNVIDFFQKNKN